MVKLTISCLPLLIDKLSAYLTFVNLGKINRFCIILYHFVFLKMNFKMLKRPSQVNLILILIGLIIIIYVIILLLIFYPSLIIRIAIHALIE
jgi:hypothetical protein